MTCINITFCRRKFGCFGLAFVFGFFMLAPMMGEAKLCPTCHGRKTVTKTFDCPVCRGEGYTGIVGYETICPRCSKNGIKGRTVQIYGRRQKIGPGTLTEPVECETCKGTGKVEEASPSKGTVADQPGKPKVIRIRRSTLEKLNQNGEYKNEKLHLIVVDD